MVWVPTSRQKSSQNRSSGAFRRSGTTLGGLWDDFGWHLEFLGFQKTSLWAFSGLPLGGPWGHLGVLGVPFGFLWGALGGF